MRRGMLISIDSLFDTRLALASLLDHNNIVKSLQNGSYPERLRDNIGNISSSVFNQFYNKRNKNIFKLAIPTPLLEVFIEEDYREMMESIKDMNTGKIPIFINTYPYKFNKDEEEYFKYIVSKVLLGADVQIINKTIEDITPDWLYENVKRMYMYDGLNWFNYHVTKGNLIVNPLLDILLFVPTIFEGTFPIANINDDFIKNTEKNASIFIDLVFINTVYFCAVNVKNEE